MSKRGAWNGIWYGILCQVHRYPALDSNGTILDDHQGAATVKSWLCMYSVQLKS